MAWWIKNDEDDNDDDDDDDDDDEIFIEKCRIAAFVVVEFSRFLHLDQGG